MTRILSANEAVTDPASSDFVKYLLVLLQLCLIATVVYLFEIEQSRHFFPVLCLMIGGFAVHSWLPKRVQLTFFAGLSIVSILFLLGMANGVAVLGVGCTLIGICYLPVSLGIRLVILSAVVALLVLLRVQYPLPFWPVVGSMFMFRLMCFLHECRKNKAMPSLAWSMSYFFLTPNACFPLFPVVDFKTFRETWYRDDQWETYQRGVTWITRGLAHLLLYRYIRKYLVPKPYELYDISKIALFVATNYSLYLQVSGQFHFITGLLHLFGFDLPRTHNWFFLASSFSDIWRRINIYWKDFMTKYFFYPMFYLLRRHHASAKTAMLLSTMVVFIATWLLHSWQTFWLLGHFPITINDACLWIGAGIAVAINILLEYRHQTNPGRSAWLVALTVSVRTVGMFILISIFWACWTKPGFLYLIRGAFGRAGATHGISIVLMWLIFVVLAGTLVAYVSQKQATQEVLKQQVDFRSSAKLHIALLSLIIALASPRSAGLFPAPIARAIAQFRSDPALTEAAGDRLLSYYEDLNTAVVQAGPLISSLSRPSDARPERSEGFNKVSRAADAYQQLELIPGITTDIDGNAFSVNQFGMRDLKSVTLEKPHNTIRIAIVGSSIVMGYGVADDDVFCRRFEALLNDSSLDKTRHLEVLNFGVGKQWAPHRLVRIQRKVVGFQPDVLFYFAHQDEFRELASHAAQLVSLGRELPSSHLKEVVSRARVTSDMAPGAIQTTLQRLETELLRATYLSIVDECRGRKIVPVWIYLPIPMATPEDLSAKLMSIASQAGFIVQDLSKWATSRDGLFDASEEFHPNRDGHQLIAEALLQMVSEHPETIPMLRQNRP